MSTPPSPKQILKSISYKKISSMTDPFTGQPLETISKKDLTRLVFILNSELFNLKNRLDEALKPSITHDLEDK